jgi:hypothetical protein
VVEGFGKYDFPYSQMTDDYTRSLILPFPSLCVH